MEDLQNYGIQTLLVDDYAEVTAILRELLRRAVRKNVFVSGSAYDPSPLSKDDLEGFARSLGREVIRSHFNVISGLGLGIGDAVTMGALEQVYASPAVQLDERLTLRPFPQSSPTKGGRDEIWERYRTDMINRAGFAVFIAGNKQDPSTGKTIEAPGVIREFEIATERGVFPIAIGGTGWAASKIGSVVLGDLPKYFGAFGSRVKESLEKLARTDVSPAVWAQAVVDIIKIVSPR